MSDNTYGEMEVKELYGELLVPVTQRLNLEFGYRYSEFNTAAGNVDTWKTLFDYAATDSIRLRGGFQQATRAPNTAEMFQGPIMLTVGVRSERPVHVHDDRAVGQPRDQPEPEAARDTAALHRPDR